MKKKHKRKNSAPAPAVAQVEAAEPVAQTPPVVPPVRRGTVCVGDTVQRKPITFTRPSDQEGTRLLRGTVIWVHPKGRYHVVEFGEGANAARECFAGVAQ